MWSHPQSLSQCAQYIADHGFDSVPFSNTAIAARDVAKEKRLNVAAICSYKACEEYGLKVLDNHLQDNDENTTRFIVISKSCTFPKMRTESAFVSRFLMLRDRCTVFCADLIRSALTSQKLNPVPVRADSLNICSTSTFRAMSEVKMLLNL